MNELKLGQSPLVIGVLVSDPSPAYSGEIYYNSGSNVFRFYNGSVWANISSGSGTVTSVSVVSANGFAGSVATATTTPAITISTTVTGLLQGNGTAISAYTGGNLTDSTAGADGITVTNGTGAVIGTGTSIAQTQSTTSTPGYLSSTDWNTFNNKLTSTLPTNEIFIGNISNVATAQTMSGDATLAANGTLTLATVATAGTTGSMTSIPSITITAKGLVTSVTGNVVVAPAGTLTGTVLASNVISSSLTSLGVQSQALNLGTNQLNNLAMAGSPEGTDGVNVTYLLAQIAAALNGLTWKGPVQAYSNANVALTGGATLTIDSYSVQNGNYVILGNQTTASQNYVYVASGIGTAYTLTEVTNSEAPTATGDAYLIQNGTVYGNTAFQVNAISPVTFIQFAGPNTYSFTSPLILTGNTVSIQQANTSQSGYLSSTDWNTFNNKQPAGNYITELTGGVTASGPGSATATVVTNANLTGPVTSVGNATSVTANAITNTMLAQMPTDTLKGNNTGVTANAADLTIAQVTAMIGVTTATASSLVERDSSGNTYQNQVNAQAPTGPQERYSTDGTNWLEVQYVNSITLTGSTSSPATVDASTTFNNTTYAGFQAEYYMFDTSSPTIVRIGKIIVVSNSNGSIASYSDNFADTASIGVTFSVNFSSPNVQLQYTNTNTNNVTMRIKITRFLR